MSTPATTPPPESLVRLTHLIYGLHAFSALMGIISTAAIVTAFLTGWPSILAVILNYAKRGEARGTYLESHFSWQIRTFWAALAKAWRLDRRFQPRMKPAERDALYRGWTEAVARVRSR